MPIWKAKAIWLEDDAEASEQWEIYSETTHDAVRKQRRTYAVSLIM